MTDYSGEIAKTMKSIVELEKQIRDIVTDTTDNSLEKKAKLKLLQQQMELLNETLQRLMAQQKNQKKSADPDTRESQETSIIKGAVKQIQILSGTGKTVPSASADGNSPGAGATGGTTDTAGTIVNTYA
ncbi:hypothetical protein ACO0LO_16025 [Undibacterium sp. TJN25]|uniref:hypothetical protein n=1 Tax=Undibacterium sp. TJN25 TaxID=3413056 RepID=UPI003BEFB346